MRAVRPWVAPALYLAVATASCFLFTAFVPPLLDPAAAASLPVVGALPGDLPGYWVRFGLSLLLLGLLPLAVALALGFRPADLGLSLGARVLRRPLFWAFVPLAVAVGAIGSLSPDLAAYYPYTHGLPAAVRTHGVGPLVLHAAAYLVLYYVPWEFFFRGFLLLGLLAGLERGFPPARPAADPPAAVAPSTAVVLVVLFQTLPSTMLHVGHPLSEFFAAIPAGIAFGVLAWRTRSIVPGLVLHATVGLATDVTIVLHAMRAGV